MSEAKQDKLKTVRELPGRALIEFKQAQAEEQLQRQQALSRLGAKDIQAIEAFRSEQPAVRRRKALSNSTPLDSETIDVFRQEQRILRQQQHREQLKALSDFEQSKGGVEEFQRQQSQLAAFEERFGVASEPHAVNSISHTLAALTKLNGLTETEVNQHIDRFGEFLQAYEQSGSLVQKNHAANYEQAEAVAGLIHFENDFELSVPLAGKDTGIQDIFNAFKAASTISDDDFDTYLERFNHFRERYYSADYLTQDRYAELYLTSNKILDLLIFEDQFKLAHYQGNGNIYQQMNAVNNLFDTDIPLVERQQTVNVLSRHMHGLKTFIQKYEQASEIVKQKHADVYEKVKKTYDKANIDVEALARLVRHIQLDLRDYGAIAAIQSDFKARAVNYERLEKYCQQLKDFHLLTETLAVNTTMPVYAALCASDGISKTEAGELQIAADLQKYLAAFKPVQRQTPPPSLTTPAMTSQVKKANASPSLLATPPGLSVSPAVQQVANDFPYLPVVAAVGLWQNIVSKIAAFFGVKRDIKSSASPTDSRVARFEREGNLLIDDLCKQKLTNTDVCVQQLAKINAFKNTHKTLIADIENSKATHMQKPKDVLNKLTTAMDFIRHEKARYETEAAMPSTSNAINPDAIQSPKDGPRAK